jgi:hypothetical protein
LPTKVEEDEDDAPRTPETHKVVRVAGTRDEVQANATKVLRDIKKNQEIRRDDLRKLISVIVHAKRTDVRTNEVRDVTSILLSYRAIYKMALIFEGRDLDEDGVDIKLAHITGKMLYDTNFDMKIRWVGQRLLELFNRPNPAILAKLLPLLEVTRKCVHDYDPRIKALLDQFNTQVWKLEITHVFKRSSYSLADIEALLEIIPSKSSDPAAEAVDTLLEKTREWNVHYEQLIREVKESNFAEMLEKGSVDDELRTELLEMKGKLVGLMQEQQEFSLSKVTEFESKIEEVKRILSVIAWQVKAEECLASFEKNLRMNQFADLESFYQGAVKHRVPQCVDNVQENRRNLRERQESDRCICKDNIQG